MSENVLQDGNLNESQLKALDSLANGATKLQAATIAGVTVRTLDRWMADDPAFDNALRIVTDAAVSDAKRRLSAMLEKSLTALEAIIENSDTKDRDKLRAIELNINNFVKLREFDELISRIEEIEQRLGI